MISCAIPFRKSETANTEYGVPIRNPTADRPSAAVIARRLHRPESATARSGAATIGRPLYLLVTASPAARPASAARPVVGFSMTRNDSQTHNRQNAAIRTSTAIFDDSFIRNGAQATTSAASTASHGEATTRRAMPYVARIITKLNKVPTDRAHMTIRGCDAVQRMPVGSFSSRRTISSIVVISPSRADHRKPPAMAGRRI